jgi:hypothetical protein
MVLRARREVRGAGNCPELRFTVPSRGGEALSARIERNAGYVAIGIGIRGLTNLLSSRRWPKVSPGLPPLLGSSSHPARKQRRRLVPVAGSASRLVDTSRGPKFALCNPVKALQMADEANEAWRDRLVRLNVPGLFQAFMRE